MINKLVIENIRHRWVRTFLCALVVGVQVMLILTLIGLSRGLLEDSAANARGTNADIFLKPGSTFSLSSGQIDERFVPFVQKQPHIRQVVGILMISIPGELITKLNGVDLQAFTAMSGGLRMEQGEPPTHPDDLAVDTYYAQQHKLHVGQTWKLLKHDWRISGIMQGGMLGRLIVRLKSLQELTGNASPGRLSEILVKLDNPELTHEEVANLNKLLDQNLTAISWQDFIGQFSINNLPQLKTFINVITVLAVLVAFLVVFLSMYTAVIERTRELGILKALGAKPFTILDMLIRESVILALGGCILGILLAYAAKSLIMVLMPATLQVVTVPDWWWKAGLIALVGALLGAIYPGLKAARQDAIEALSYE